tara:strand:- start:394 stop:1227 length:834 start_codon:yes stop_codon:yes gene_type:complete
LILKTFIIVLIFSSKLVFALDCQNCKAENDFYYYINKLVERYEKHTCSKNLIPFLTEGSFTQEQRCQIIDDLSILKNLQFSNYGDRFNELFNPSRGPEYAGIEIFEWLIKRVTKIRLINSNVSTAINYGLCEHTNVCHEDHVRGDIGLDDSYFKKDNPIERISILLHEARHTDGHDFLNNYDNNIESDSLHVACESIQVSIDNTNALDARKICDKDINGSIGTSLIFLGNVLENCKKCDGLTIYNDSELSDYYIKNLYNNSLMLINDYNFDLGVTVK